MASRSDALVAEQMPHFLPLLCCMHLLVVLPQGLRNNRSCTLVPECISDKRTTLNISANGVRRQVVTSGGTAAKCAPLDDILRRYTDMKDEPYVDLWVLDVEGHELIVLRGVDFSQIKVDAMLIEFVWLPYFPNYLDMLMTENGFMKYMQLIIDSLYVRRGTQAASSERPHWLHPRTKADIKLNLDWAVSTQQELTKTWFDHLNQEIARNGT